MKELIKPIKEVVASEAEGYCENNKSRVINRWNCLPYEDCGTFSIHSGYEQADEDILF